MNKRILFGLAGGLFLAGSVIAQETTGVAPAEPAGTVIKGKAPVAKELLKVRFPKPKSFTLKNGVTVYVLEDHRTPAIRLSLAIRAGAIFEPKPGVAVATAALMTEGTKSKTTAEIAEETEDAGIALGAGAGLDTVTLSASGLSETTDEVIDLLADVLLHPAYAPDRLDRYKFAQRSGNAQRRTNPTGMLGELTQQVFYGGSKYARLTPSRPEIQALTTDDLIGFHDAFYKPDGAVLGVTGDVDVKKLRAKLESALAEWKPVGKATDLPAADFKGPASPHILLIDRPGSAQSNLQFGCLAVRQSDPDFIALTVANRILGGGSTGRLFQNIRERKGYTYGAYSTLTGGKWPGIWGANAAVRTEVTQPAIGEFFYEFKRLQDEPVTDDELTRAKRSIIGSFARTLESPEGILARTLELVANDLPLNYWDTYPAAIQAVTPADIQRVAKKYFGVGIQLMIVGERKKIEDGLAKYGTVQIVDGSKIGSLVLN